VADDRDLPGIPSGKMPARDRLDTRRDPPGRPERKPTIKVAVPPPGTGNQEPPKRSYSPAPVEEPQPTSAEYGARVAELGGTIEELTERAERAEAALARERRKSAPRVESEAVPGPMPKVEAEAIIITRKGLSLNWSMLPWVIASLAGGWAAKTHVDRGAPSAKDVTVTAAVAAKGVDDATASASANATEIATVKAECRENDGYLIDVIEQLRPGLEVARPANLPKARKMITKAKKEDGASPLKVGSGGKIVIEPEKTEADPGFR